VVRIFHPPRQAAAKVASAGLPPYLLGTVTEPHRILVVDDSAELRENLVECLDLEGYAASAVADAAQALSALGRDPLPHLVLIDQVMPGLSGLELAARIRAEPRLAGVRLVLASGSHHRGPLPVDEFLDKPFGVGELTRVLHRLLGA
jgi:CheY-like chemotaxis protein